MSLLAAVCVTATPAHAQLMARPTVIQNVRIITMDGEVIENGSIVIRGSRISAIGADVSAPRMAVRIDGSGMVATPGLIDVHSALGMPRGASGGNDPTASAIDAFDRYDTRAIEEAIRHGVTTVYVAPVGHRGFGPAGSIIRLRPDELGARAYGEVMEPRAALTLNLRSDADPIDRLQLIDGLRSQLRAVRDYEESLEFYAEELEEYLKKLEERREAEGENDETGQERPAIRRERGRAGAMVADDDLQPTPRRRPRPDQRGERRPPQQQPTQREQEESDEDALEKPKRPAPNRRHDALIKALNHELPVRVLANRSEDILNALEVAEEFGLKMILEGGTEAHLVARELEKANMPILLAPLRASDLPRTGTQVREAKDATATLERAGVQWTLGSGGRSASASRHLHMHAQILVHHGRLDIDPLELITLRAATLLGIDNQVGRLAEGMQADIVLWSGSSAAPNDPTSRVRRVLIAGRTVYEATDEPEDDA